MDALTVAGVGNAVRACSRNYGAANHDPLYGRCCARGLTAWVVGMFGQGYTQRTRRLMVVAAGGEIGDSQASGA